MNDGEFDLYGNSNKINEKSSLSGEHIATMQSIVSIYERRFNRFQEEKKLLSELIESQYSFISKLGITSDNMILSPVGNIQELDTGNNDNSDYSEYEDNNEKSENNTKNEITAKKQDKHLYIPSDTNFYLNFLKSVTKNNPNNKSKHDKNHKSYSMHKIFQKFPIFESVLFDHNCSFDIQPICEYIQTLDQVKRQEFYTEIWSSLNNLPFIFNTLFSLLESNSFNFLSELADSILSKSFNFSHVILYLYDSKNSLLTIDKQKTKINHVLNDGLISNAIKNNQPIFIDRNDPKIKEDDLIIMAKQTKALFIPIPKISAVISFFDKIDTFTPLDDLIAHSSSSIINEIAHALQLHKQTNDTISTFKDISSIFIELSSISNIKDFLNIMTNSLTKQFNCSHVSIFNVSQSSQSFWKLDENENSTNKKSTFSIGHGIVGTSISKKSTMAITDPELSVLFENGTDRPEAGMKAHSILCCPIFDGKSEVKWSIVLYNKLNCDGFSQDDITSVEILSHHLHRVIFSMLEKNKISGEVKKTDQKDDSIEKIVDFTSHLSDLNDLASITSQLPNEINGINRANVYFVDRRLNSIIGSNEDGTFYMEQIKEDSDDPIVKFTFEGQIKAKRANFFCPLVGMNEKVVGMMVLNSSSLKTSDSSSKPSLSMFSSRSARPNKESKLQKKLALFGQKEEKNISNSNSDDFFFDSWRKIVGQLVEAIECSKKDKQLILLEERMIGSLLTLDRHTISYLYPQVELNFISRKNELSKSGNENEKTVPLTSFEFNEDISKNYISLVSALSQLKGNCHFLSLKEKIKKVEKNDILAEGFQPSKSFDVFQYNEKQISMMLVKMMHDLEISDFFNLDHTQSQKLIDNFRYLHMSKVFSNWKLSIDRVQFLYYFLNQTNLANEFTQIQKAALFCYLLALNCDPIVSDFNDDDENISIAKSRYFLESGPSLNIGTTVFTVLSSIPDSPFFLLNNDDQSLFFKKLESLDQINEIDVSLTSDIFVLTTLICTFSYLSRDLNISKNWVKLRFEEELDEVSDEVVNYQLEFEMRVIIQPALIEFAKKNIKIDEIRDNFTDCLTQITSFKF